MQHFMTYEFIYEFMYMKNIVKSYLNSGVSRFQMVGVTPTRGGAIQPLAWPCLLSQPPDSELGRASWISRMT